MDAVPSIWELFQLWVIRIEIEYSGTLLNRHPSSVDTHDITDKFLQFVYGGYCMITKTVRVIFVCIPTSV